MVIGHELQRVVNVCINHWPWREKVCLKGYQLKLLPHPLTCVLVLTAGTVPLLFIIFYINY